MKFNYRISVTATVSVGADELGNDSPMNYAKVLENRIKEYDVSLDDMFSSINEERPFIANVELLPL